MSFNCLLEDDIIIVYCVCGGKRLGFEECVTITCIKHSHK